MVIYEVTEYIMEEVYQKVMKDEISEKEAYYRNVVVPIVKNTNSYLYVLEENNTYIGTGGLILTKRTT